MTVQTSEIKADACYGSIGLNKVGLNKSEELKHGSITKAKTEQGATGSPPRARRHRRAAVGRLPQL
jgi:hypothetical protein